MIALERTGDSEAERGECIGDVRRDSAVHRADDHAIPFEVAQSLGEHPVADAVDAAPDLTEAHGLVGQP